MCRRFQFQQRMRLDGIEIRRMRRRLRPAEFCPARDMQDLPAEAPVPEERADRVEAREAPVAVIVPEEGRRLFMDRRIGRVGVVEESRVPRIEVEAAVLQVEGLALHA